MLYHPERVVTFYRVLEVILPSFLRAGGAAEVRLEDLLSRLEEAIALGHFERAAALAKQLAALKRPAAGGGVAAPTPVPRSVVDSSPSPSSSLSNRLAVSPIG